MVEGTIIVEVGATVVIETEVAMVGNAEMTVVIDKDISLEILQLMAMELKRKTSNRMKMMVKVKEVSNANKEAGIAREEEGAREAEDADSMSIERLARDNMMMIKRKRHSKAMIRLMIRVR